MTTLKQIEKALKEVLLSKPKDKAKYENKKPTKAEKNQKWRLDESPNPKIEIKKNTQTPTGIMISTKKKFHPLGENQRQSKPLINQPNFMRF
ncbi:hypothetical protein [uncultured Gammaproteobacteria bacterium]|nr:hypothetical protein [uncultured Gammaproteobacteria bacterium]